MVRLAVVPICVAFLAVILEVIMRQLGRPLEWALETTEFCLAMTTLLCSAWLVKKEGHISIDFVTDRLSARHAARLTAITSIVASIVCFVITYYGIFMTIDYARRGMKFVTAMQPLQWPFLIFVPLGFFFIAIQLLRRSYKYWQQSRKAPQGPKELVMDFDKEL